MLKTILWLILLTGIGIAIVTFYRGTEVDVQQAQRVANHIDLASREVASCAPYTPIVGTVRDFPLTGANGDISVFCTDTNGKVHGAVFLRPDPQ